MAEGGLLCLMERFQCAEPHLETANSMANAFRSCLNVSAFRC